MGEEPSQLGGNSPTDERLCLTIQREFERLGRQLRSDICAELQASLKVGISGERPCFGTAEPSCNHEGALPVLLSHPMASAATPTSVYPPVLPSTSRSSITTARSREPHIWTQRHRRSFLGMQQARRLLELEWLGASGRGWSSAWQSVRACLGRCWRPREDVRRVADASRKSQPANADAVSVFTKNSADVKQPCDKENGPMFSKAGSARSVSKERTERAMGLTPSRTIDEFPSEGQQSKARIFARSVVRNPIFEFAIQAAIVVNAVQVGLQTDLMAEDLTLDVPTRHKVANLAFCFVFMAEVSLRLFAYRLKFFTMWGCGWNVFDLVLVIVQVTEEVLLLLGASTGKIAHHVGWPNNTLIRVARILRVVKVVRVVRVMRYFEDLRLLVICILHSARPFIWALALIMVIIYVVGTYLTHIVLVHRIVDGVSSEDAAPLDEYYGTVSRSVLSLFQGLTGGVDWRDLLDPLLDHAPLRWAAAGFLLYLAFAILGIMNVVTGTFVQHAIERSQEVKEVNKVNMARKLFKSLDFDASGCITFEEIQDHVHTPAVQEFLESIDVDISEARCLFEVIDMSGSGSIDFDEFLHGCLRLQGPARALDLVLLTRDSRRCFEQQAAMLQQLLSNQQSPPPPPGGHGDFTSTSVYEFDQPDFASPDLPTEASAAVPMDLIEDEC